jgi:SAM-dependent methyltransferase
MVDLRFGGKPGYLLLRALSAPPLQGLAATADEDFGASRLELDLGKEVWKYIEQRVVLDFGCGQGSEVVAAACKGASKAYGIEISDLFLEAAKKEANRAGVGERCVFLHGQRQAEEVASIYGTVDTVLSLDAFEHFSNPAEILAEIYKLLKPGGRLLVNFGPPWNHPYGAHARYFTRVPWVHLVFSEQALLKVRALYRNDGATRFEEIQGGLNRMTVRRFRTLVTRSNFETEIFRLRPVKGCGWLIRHGILLEYLTSAVLAVLVKPL